MAKDSNKKKDIIRLVCIVCSLFFAAAFLVIGLPKIFEGMNKPPYEPHIFYDGAIYYTSNGYETESYEILEDVIIEDGSVNELLFSTELCNSDYQTNSYLYMGSVIYRLKDSSDEKIYVKPPGFEKTLLTFYRISEKEFKKMN